MQPTEGRAPGYALEIDQQRPAARGAWGGRARADAPTVAGVSEHRSAQAGAPMLAPRRPPTRRIRAAAKPGRRCRAHRELAAEPPGDDGRAARPSLGLGNTGGTRASTAGFGSVRSEGRRRALHAVLGGGDGGLPVIPTRGVDALYVSSSCAPRRCALMVCASSGRSSATISSQTWICWPMRWQCPWSRSTANWIPMS